MDMDKVTYYIKRTLNVLFLYNVLGTSYGVLVGLLLLSLQDFLASFYQPIGLIKGFGFLVFGVLLFNIKYLIKKKYEDPYIEAKLKYIREMIKSGHFSEQEKRLIWRKAINSLILEVDGNIDNESKGNSNTSVQE